MAWPRAWPVVGGQDALAGGHPELSVDQVDAGGQLGDRVLDLEPGVHLQEVELVGGRLVEELDGAGVLVVGARAMSQAALPSATRTSSGRPGAGASSTSFWWRRWSEQSRSPRNTTSPRPSARTWASTWRGLQVALGVDLVAAEGGLDSRRADSSPAATSSGLTDHLHAPAAAAEGALRASG